MGANVQEFVVCLLGANEKDVFLGFVLTGDTGDAAVVEYLHVQLGGHVLDETVGVELLGDYLNLLDIPQQCQQHLLINILVNILINIQRLNLQILSHRVNILPVFLLKMQRQLVISHLVMVFISVVH